MANASDRWPKYRAPWDEWRPACQARRPGRVSPRLLPPRPRRRPRYDDGIGNFPA
jgi:hypothetical protein